MGKMKEQFMELPEVDPQEELYYETVEVLRKILDSNILTDDEMSTLLYATAVRRDHVINQEEVDAAEEQSLEYFNRYIAGDRK